MENGKSVPRQGATSSLAVNNGTKRRNDNGTMPRLVARTRFAGSIVDWAMAYELAPTHMHI